MPIKAEFADFKIVKTRGVAQFIFEVPIENADKALHELGGVPQFASNQWVAVAALNDVATITQEKPKRRLADMSLAQQAGILCGDAKFLRFMSVVYDEREGDPAAFVRRWCHVKSRREFDTNENAGLIFQKLKTEFLVWSGRMAQPR